MSRSDISAATAVVPTAGGRRVSVDGSLERHGDESALRRLRYVFEDIALSRWAAAACSGAAEGGLHRGSTTARTVASPTVAG